MHSYENAKRKAMFAYFYPPIKETCFLLDQFNSYWMYAYWESQNKILVRNFRNSVQQSEDDNLLYGE